MKNFIVATILIGLSLHTTQISAMYRHNSQGNKTTDTPSVNIEQVVQKLLNKNNRDEINAFIQKNFRSLIQYREHETDNTLLHLAVIKKHHELIKAILASSLGNPLHNFTQSPYQDLEKAKLDMIRKMADLDYPPLALVYNSDQDTPQQLAVRLGIKPIKDLFLVLYN